MGRLPGRCRIPGAWFGRSMKIPVARPGGTAEPSKQE